MLNMAVLFFSLAILLGLFLVTLILKNKNPPKQAILTHGSLAGIGLLLLIIYSLFNTPSPMVSIILFTLVALGGVMMVYRQMTGRTVPKWMAIGHGIIALVAFVFLIIFTFFR